MLITRGGHSIIKLNTTCQQSLLPLFYIYITMDSIFAVFFDNFESSSFLGIISAYFMLCTLSAMCFNVCCDKLWVLNPHGMLPMNI